MAKKRQRMKDWLIDHLNHRTFNGILDWYPDEQQKGRRLFLIKWLHASTVNYSDEDSRLFKEWCRHTGKLRDGDNAKRWKANFRCALNSLPDVVKVDGLTRKKGKGAYRIFEVLAEKVQEKVDRKKENNARFLKTKLEKRQSRNEATLAAEDQAPTRRSTRTQKSRRRPISREVKDEHVQPYLDHNANDIPSPAMKPATSSATLNAYTSADVLLPLTVAYMNDDDLQSSSHAPSDSGVDTDHDKFGDFYKSGGSCKSGDSLSSSRGASPAAKQEEFLNDMDEILSTQMPSDRSCLPAPVSDMDANFPWMLPYSGKVVVRTNMPIEAGSLTCQRDDLSCMMTDM